MAKLTLVEAFDIMRDDSPSVQRSTYSYRLDGQWHIVYCGRTYHTTYKVLDVSPREEEILKSIEQREPSRPDPTTIMGVVKP